MNRSIYAAAERMKARAMDFDGGTPYQQTANILALSIATNVESGGRPKWRERNGFYYHPILDKTGLMRDSAEQSAKTWQKTMEGYVNQVISTDYGYIHQYRGVKTQTTGGTRKIIRKFVVIQPDERTSMVKAFRNAFLRK